MLLKTIVLQGRANGVLRELISCPRRHKAFRAPRRIPCGRPCMGTGRNAILLLVAGVAPFPKSCSSVKLTPDGLGLGPTAREARKQECKCSRGFAPLAVCPVPLGRSGTRIGTCPMPVRVAQEPARVARECHHGYLCGWMPPATTVNRLTAFSFRHPTVFQGAEDLR
jgi:hypothetical protein